MRPMQVVYQNADTNSMNRVQSVSPQGVAMQPNKLQYLPNVNKMYQQTYQPNAMTVRIFECFIPALADFLSSFNTRNNQCNGSLLSRSFIGIYPVCIVAAYSRWKLNNGFFILQAQMMPAQQCRSNMVSPSARQIMSRENSLSPLPQQTPQWHTPQINMNPSMTIKAMPALINVNAHSLNDDSYKITLPSTTRMKPITPPSIGVYLNCVLIVSKGFGEMGQLQSFFGPLNQICS